MTDDMIYASIEEYRAHLQAEAERLSRTLRIPRPGPSPADMPKKKREETPS